MSEFNEFNMVSKRSSLPPEEVHKRIKKCLGELFLQHADEFHDLEVKWYENIWELKFSIRHFIVRVKLIVEPRKLYSRVKLFIRNLGFATNFDEVRENIKSEITKEVEKLLS